MMSNMLVTLRRISPNLTSDSLRCETCQQPPTSYEIEEELPSILLRCPCEKEWFICRLCRFNCTVVHSTQALQQHLTKKHWRKKRKQSAQDSFVATSPITDSADNCFDTAPDTDDILSFDLTTTPSNKGCNLLLGDQITTALDIGTVTETNKAKILDDGARRWLRSDPKRKFFLQRAMGGLTGCQYLLSMNLFGIERTSGVSEEDARTHLSVGDLFRKLSRNQQDTLSKVFGTLKPYMLPGFAMNEKTQVSSKRFILPSQMSSVRKMYTEGATSFKKILPGVPFSPVGSGTSKNLHSYAKVIDCLEHHLSVGNGVFDLNDIPCSKRWKLKTDRVTQPSESKRVSEILSESKKVINLSLENEKYPVRVVGISSFSDDFNPTISIIKANVHGIWVYQITFLQEEDPALEFGNTYVIALGWKGSDHTQVLKKIEDEIDFLSSGGCPPMFDGKANIMVKPYLAPYVRHGDQPEQRAVCGLKLGMKTNHGRFRWSLDYKEVGKFLPSCTACKTRLEKVFNSHDFSTSFLFECSAEHCTNWIMKKCLLILHSTPDSAFPTDQIPPSGKLPPIQLTFLILRKAAELCHAKISDGSWSQSSGESYLSYHCIKTDISEGIIENAMNIKMCGLCIGKQRNK